MNKKYKLFLLSLLSGASIMGLVLVGNHDLLPFGSQLTKASSSIESSIVFSKNDSFESLGNNNYKLQSSTYTKCPIYCLVENSIALSGSYIANFTNNFENEKSTRLSFYYDEDCTEPFLFQKVKSIKFNCGGSFYAYYSVRQNGQDSFGDLNTFPANTEYALTHTANSQLIIQGAEKGSRQSQTRNVTSFEIFYSCESGGSVTDDLTGIRIDGYSTEYGIGDIFSFDGKCYANYSLSGEKEVTPDNVSSPDMTSEGTKEVIVSYGGKTASYTIEVSNGGEPTPETFSGVYLLDEITLTFNADGSGTYRNKSKTSNFTFEKNGSSITLTNSDSQIVDNGYAYGYYPFSYSVNSVVGELNGDNSQITLTICNMATSKSASSNKTFSLQK